MKKKIWEEERGAALIWAICASAMLMILVGGSLTLAQAYFNRSINNLNSKQAYYTALSGAELVANRIVEQTDASIASGTVFYDVNGLDEASVYIPVPATEKQGDGLIVEFPEEKNMGECRVWVYWKNDTTVVVESVGAYKNQTDNVKIELQHETIEASEVGEGEPERNTFYSTAYLSNPNNTAFYNTDIYLTKFMGWLSRWSENHNPERNNEFFDHTETNYNMVMNTIVQRPPDTGVIERTLTRNNYGYELNNLQPGNVYHFEMSDNSREYVRNNTRFNLSFQSGEIGEATVFITADNWRCDVEYVVESVQEGITIYYYSSNEFNTLKIGNNNNSNIIWEGGIYTKGLLETHGRVNVLGYIFFDNWLFNYNNLGSNRPIVGYVDIPEESLRWEITKYTLD